MARTRDGLLDGALSVVERDGLRRADHVGGRRPLRRREGHAVQPLPDQGRRAARARPARGRADRRRRGPRPRTRVPPAPTSGGYGGRARRAAAGTVAEHVAGAPGGASSDPGALAPLLRSRDAGPAGQRAVGGWRDLLGVPAARPAGRGWPPAGWCGQVFDPRGRAGAGGRGDRAGAARRLSPRRGLRDPAAALATPGRQRSDPRGAEVRARLTARAPVASSARCGSGPGRPGAPACRNAGTGRPPRWYTQCSLSAAWCHRSSTCATRSTVRAS